MEKDPENHLQLIGQLAREYQEKLERLEQFAEKADTRELLQQLRSLAELTTDRFRSAQLYLLDSRDPGNERQDELNSMAVLFSCFDEMRILFQIVTDSAMKCEQKL